MTCRHGHPWEGERDSRGFRLCSACKRSRRGCGSRPRPTWHRIIGARAAEHPPVAPALLVEAPQKLDISSLVSAAADAAFDAGFGYGAGGDASHGLSALAGLLASAGASLSEALAGLEREYRAGLRQGRALRRAGRLALLLFLAAALPLSALDVSDRPETYETRSGILEATR